ncbi:hypothetical protein DFQ30_002512 [Apophysomyces sp. BC1015]|nr:hypothetical protein DFQ30_002512 [Apophysomyces sp. BC1015]KAG0179989.1 hypothetical protein DFQ29_001396 [Apophysomyces sp. BC1021]
MAAVLPVILIGTPIGYFTWTKVFDSVDHVVTRVCHEQDSSEPPRSTLAAAAGSVISLAALSKVTFSKNTRHRLFFAKPPPNTNIRTATLKMALELLFRSGVVFYGSAAGGAVSTNIATYNKRT